MKLLGLTGNIACGKSTVAGWLREWGAEVLDADQLVHELYTDTGFAAQVASLFGEGILTPLGTVDRRELSAFVFGDAANLRRLELLVHPAVARLRAEKLQELESRKEPPRVVVLEAVKLLESEQARGCAVVWCVNCSPETQVQRLKERRGLSQKEACARLTSQPCTAQKEALAREQGVPLFFLNNETTPDELKAQVESLWSELMSVASKKRTVNSRGSKLRE